MKPAPIRSLNRAALIVLCVYKNTLSPVLYFFGARCRHSPACSDYAAEAFCKHNSGCAFWLSLSRVLRCHPFGSSGYDPVPDAAPDVGWRFWRLGDWAWQERGELLNPHEEDLELTPPCEEQRRSK